VAFRDTFSRENLALICILDNDITPPVLQQIFTIRVFTMNCKIYCINFVFALIRDFWIKPWFSYRIRSNGQTGYYKPRIVRNRSGCRFRGSLESDIWCGGGFFEWGRFRVGVGENVGAEVGVEVGGVCVGVVVKVEENFGVGVEIIVATMVGEDVCKLVTMGVGLRWLM
jgi:hypothetical protein